MPATQYKLDCKNRTYAVGQPPFFAIGTKWYYDRIQGMYLDKASLDAQLAKEGKTMAASELGNAADITTWKSLGHLYSGI